MPIYEYECGLCHHRFEIIQKFSDKPLSTCPNCGKSTLSKCISLSSFHLKGSGWYKTDVAKTKEEIKTPETKGGEVNQLKKGEDQGKGDQHQANQKKCETEAVEKKQPSHQQKEIGSTPKKGGSCRCTDCSCDKDKH